MRRRIGMALWLSCMCAPAVASTLPAVRHTLSNGVQLIVSEQHALPMVVVQMLVDAGARWDPTNQEGLAALTADLLTEGTKSRTASQISEQADFIGASLSTSADVDYASLGLTVLRKDLDTGLGLLTDVLLHPTFPEAEVTRRREAALATIRADEDDPGRVAERALTSTLFRNQPYGHLAIGTAAALRRLTRAEIEGFYHARYHPEQTIVTVVGDVSADEITERFETVLRGWQPGHERAFVYPPVPAESPEVVEINKPVTQTSIILAERGIARNNPDYYVITVMNYILGGGGFSSHLLDNIRTKAGLAYSVSSFFSVNKSPGSFQIVMQTKNASADDAIHRACAEIERIRSESVSDEELQNAKRYLTGSFPMRLDTNAKIAGFLAQVAFFNLGDDYADTYAQRINDVTKEDVQRVAQQYLHPDQLDLVVVGDLAQANVPRHAACTAVAAP
ncbi:MAG TPA: pitrilysin family protein [Candidatus Acidoferrales bacterium]|nr:pitrilysin family protein [Candidatus Acidoferrales bacterium]